MLKMVKKTFDIEALIDVCTKKGYGYRIEGDNPKLVLVGESHDEKCLDTQEEMIRIVKPKVILHEGADQSLNYRSETKRILSWKDLFNIPVELCDIPHKNSSSPRHSKEHLENLMRLMATPFGFESDYKLYIDMTSPLRELYMAKIILAHIKKNNSPLFAVVGTGHALPDSRIHPSLRNERLSYLTIVQQPEALELLDEYGKFFTR